MLVLESSNSAVQKATCHIAGNTARVLNAWLYKECQGKTLEVPEDHFCEQCGCELEEEGGKGMGVQWFDDRLLFWCFWMHGVPLYLCVSHVSGSCELRASYLPQELNSLLLQHTWECSVRCRVSHVHCSTRADKTQQQTPCDGNGIPEMALAARSLSVRTPGVAGPREWLLALPGPQLNSLAVPDFVEILKAEL